MIVDALVGLVMFHVRECVLSMFSVHVDMESGQAGHIQGRQAVENPDSHFRSPVRPLALFFAVVFDLERLIIRHVRDIE